MIVLEGIKKTYENKKGRFEALKTIDLTIKKGEIFGFVGYSGAGKSTLLRLINGLELPSQGTVTIDNKELSDLSKRAIRKERQSIGMIFQHFNLLWSRTVLENIMFPLEIANVTKEKRIKKAKELIELVGLSDKENAYPSQLSGGEKQRVGIARALANDPKVLLSDEATSALDPQTTDEVLKLLEKINKELNVTIILITHEMEVVRKICHRVAVMDSGEIVEEGPVLDVFKQPKHMVTKRFVKQDRKMDKKEMQEAMEELQVLYPEGDMVQILFQGSSVNLPIITEVSRETGVDINIIQGSIQSTHEVSVGTLVVQVLGAREKRQKALELFRSYPVEVEVLLNAK
ncbi:methionine ABC transporter ATP-binding protein [Alkalibacterium kapii]|uniref:Methionine import ATP-binding protein MetN 2 n=1 Tax=Alkalibacterium kapii TaxID=426704 RepID=A0A511AT77_9LACT|nr:ATP-binding cassette domain-containing protein [Alkalibacterium kapii]GEK91408.1 methionine import ATP-binding protein MetN 2 [Alkalibacterium kapii]